MIQYQRPPAPATFAPPRPRVRGPFDAQVWRKHKDAFIRAQHGKCGYCETAIAGSQHGDVEHYAPKSAVHERAPAPSGGTTVRSKTGYWWRAYDWSNYLYACQVCNQSYKGSVFPLDPSPPKGWRPTKRDRMHRSLLLNCFDDDAPWRHFEVAVVSGDLIGRTPRGSATITTCGLRREYLRIDRQRLVRKANAQLDDILSRGEALAVKVRAWRELATLGHASAPFAGAVRNAAEMRLAPMRWLEIEAAARAFRGP